MLGLGEIHWHHWHAGKLVEVKVRLERHDLDAIEQQAIVAEYQQGLYGLTPSAYHALVSDAATFMGGIIPRQHVELLTAYVITRLDLHHTQAVARHRSPA